MRARSRSWTPRCAISPRGRCWCSRSRGPRWTTAFRSSGQAGRSGWRSVRSGERRASGSRARCSGARRIPRWSSASCSVSEGNALFLEELVRAALEGGGGEAPGTLMAMLQARIERLAPEERRVLRVASVLGERFRDGDVGALLGADERTLDGWLRGLALRDVLVAHRDGAQAEHRFRHALVREAAYGVLPELERRALAPRGGRAPRAHGHRACRRGRALRTRRLARARDRVLSRRRQARARAPSRTRTASAGREADSVRRRGRRCAGCSSRSMRARRCASNAFDLTCSRARSRR